MNREKIASDSDYSFRAIVPMLMLFAGVFFWVWATREPYYITPPSRLILMSVPVGVVVALLAFWMLYKKPGEKLPIGDRLFGFTSMIVGCTLMVSCIAVHINENYATGVKYELQRPVVGKWKDNSTRYRHREPPGYISFRVNRKRLEFHIPLDLWHSLDRGDMILLRVREGALGVNFVDDIIPASSKTFLK